MHQCPMGGYDPGPKSSERHVRLQGVVFIKVLEVSTHSRHKLRLWGLEKVSENTTLKPHRFMPVQCILYRLLKKLIISYKPLRSAFEQTLYNIIIGTLKLQPRR